MSATRIVIATTKSWNVDRALGFQKQSEPVLYVEVLMGEHQLTDEYLQEKQPDSIFFPHWSCIIPDEITDTWRCVIFHTSPLPYGRGGSPIQNQIARGVYESEVCAVKPVSDVDAGPAYLRRPVDLSKRNVEEILMQVSEIVFDMIPLIVRENFSPVDQDGEPVTFRRRKPQQSELPREPRAPRQVYDHIRMLDGEGYPAAYIQYGTNRVELGNARLHPDGTITGTFSIRLSNREGN